MQRDRDARCSRPDRRAAPLVKDRYTERGPAKRRIAGPQGAVSAYRPCSNAEHSHYRAADYERDAFRQLGAVHVQQQARHRDERDR